MASNGTEKKTLVKTKPRVESRRVLVTGGAGFVGSHVCDALIARGDYVSISFLTDQQCVGSSQLHRCIVTVLSWFLY